MATKDNKTMLRCDPLIARMIGTISQWENRPQYEIVEEALTEWLTRKDYKKKLEELPN